MLSSISTSLLAALVLRIMFTELDVQRGINDYLDFFKCIDHTTVLCCPYASLFYPLLRTTRGDASGLAFTFITDSDRDRVNELISVLEVQIFE